MALDLWLPAAGECGGSAYASATSLTFDNVSVSESMAGLKGGGVALTGDTSVGRFFKSNFSIDFRCKRFHDFFCRASLLFGLRLMMFNPPLF